MNMNKILAAGLIAAVASTASFAECGNGGFYVGANAGVAFTKMKVSASDKIDVVDENETKITPSFSQRKTKFLTELVFGYDHRINDVMLGVDLTFGMMFGKTKRMYNGWVEAGGVVHYVKQDKDFLSVKNNWSIGFMPRVGYLVMPQAELYVTFGAKVSHFKVTYSDSDVDTGATAKSTTSAKGAKFIPVVGAGVRYEITPDIFAKLEYNYEFKKGLKMPSDLSTKSETVTATTGGGNANSIKIPAHIIKLGVGFRF